MADKRLYLVQIHGDDFDYDAFVSAVVWAENSHMAKQAIRKDGRYILESQKARLTARLAPKSGIVLQHWHAG